MARHWFLTRHGNIWIYTPNLIGCARVLSTVVAFSLASAHPTAFAVLYFFGFVADETDGRFARKYQQTSTLGAVLDMVTDRVATAGLLMLLCKAYPGWFLLFVILLQLDISSHWFQMYSTLVAGNTTHKDVASHSLLVRLYYQHRVFMGVCCISCEVLYLMCFLNSNPAYQQWGLVQLPIPVSPATSRLGVLHGGRVPTVVLLVWAAFPGVLIKQLVNCVQLKNAMSVLVVYDQQKGNPAHVSKQQ